MAKDEEDETVKPSSAWNDHNVEISDIFVSRSDRIVTTAKDMSCRVCVNSVLLNTIRIPWPKSL